ncbi:MAG: transposase [Solirubrobacterales bacterium]|nr:transposase [Solirubrobacterales bacterium]
MAPHERELRALCEAGKRKSVKSRYHRGLARNLVKVWPALWTFVEAEGVEPTNNRAERGLRHAVIYRKLPVPWSERHRALASSMPRGASCHIPRENPAIRRPPLRTSAGDFARGLSTIEARASC